MSSSCDKLQHDLQEKGDATVVIHSPRAMNLFLRLRPVFYMVSTSYLARHHPRT